MATEYQHLSNALGRDDYYFTRHATHTLLVYWWFVAGRTFKTLTLALRRLFGEPMSELRMARMFTSMSINISDLISLCNKTYSLQVQSTEYYMAIVGSTQLVNKTMIGMRPYPTFVVYDE